MRFTTVLKFPLLQTRFWAELFSSFAGPIHGEIASIGLFVRFLLH